VEQSDGEKEYPQKLSQKTDSGERPDGISKNPHRSKVVMFIILEFKKMSDTTEQYLERARRIAESQGDSLKKPLDTTLQSSGWEVRRISRWLAHT
jgi:hypothetical protein